ncbi:hypothetical protein P691DRAFT_780015 [Macrolepiota fuliginosa MF-IS2]|uniref:Uncharacterized protein n=1 Tax=Macrolepiota fuliginosa MF-IS2 TaxID=1400762 RepID=A0A9P5X0L2_9AGAR|nr:hypothetical protein P691DRAFT_780015 [Macrolepiota fuliginosa MF-IS2]
MANLIRLPKLGSDWTFNELASYHINLQQQEALQFLGVQALPQPVVDPEILNNLDAAAMQQDNHAELVNLLDLAMIPSKGETAVDDFVVELFKYLGYVRRNRVARTRVDIPLNICGEVRHAKTDVCLIDRMQNDIILLVQEDKRLEDTEPTNARAQLVAEAVTAFTENNINRDALGLPPLAEKVIPGIVMVGTMPTFFKIPVTQTLATHIAFGTYPPAETIVNYCYPPVPRPARRRSEGMKPLDNRREVLKCYEAFKAIVGI